MHVMTAPAPDCRIPKGTVYFFPTSVVEWLKDQILDPDSLGSNLCPHNLVIARSLVSLSPSLLDCKVGQSRFYVDLCLEN